MKKALLFFSLLFLGGLCFAQEVYPFQLIEVKPTFNGGDTSEFIKWIQSEMGKIGVNPSDIGKRVTAQITVDVDGSVNARMIKGLNSPLDDDVVNIMNKSPKWEPGKHNGKSVAVSITVPLLIKEGEPYSFKTKDESILGYWFNGSTLVRFDEKYCYCAQDVHLTDSIIEFQKYTYTINSIGEVTIGEDENSEPEGMPYYLFTKVGKEYYLYVFFGDELGEENYEEHYQERLAYGPRYYRVNAPVFATSE